LEGGLLTESEVSGLLYLIREPDVCAYGDQVSALLITDQVSLPQSSGASLPLSIKFVE
jgi:hypothetical protein